MLPKLQIFKIHTHTCLYKVSNATQMVQQNIEVFRINTVKAYRGSRTGWMSVVNFTPCPV